MGSNPEQVWSVQEFIANLHGGLKAGSAYITLQRMECRGLLVSTQIAPELNCGTHHIRRVYRPTAAAQVLLSRHAVEASVSLESDDTRATR